MFQLKSRFRSARTSRHAGFRLCLRKGASTVNNAQPFPPPPSKNDFTLSPHIMSMSTTVSVSDAGQDDEEQHSANPKFWLQFRTFNDGSEPLPRDSTLTPACDSLPQFARLPPELRQKIWALLVQPRIVVGCCLRRADADEPDGEAQEKLKERLGELDRRTTRGVAVPALLHVNREARDVGLRHYELTFGWRISKMLSDTPTGRPPQVYFNYEQDCLMLTGELEAYDSYGFNLPMVYFLKREDTFRVKHVAFPFRELGYPEEESDQIFGCLWHVVDRFPKAERLLLTVGEGDVERLEGLGGRMLTEDNVVQKIWSGWMSGTTVTSSRMADKQMLLVKEEELMGFITAHA